MLALFRLPEDDYKRFLNFLTTHDCLPNFREFRSGPVAVPAVASPPDPRNS